MVKCQRLFHGKVLLASTASPGVEKIFSTRLACHWLQPLITPPLWGCKWASLWKLEAKIFLSPAAEALGNLCVMQMVRSDFWNVTNYVLDIICNDCQLRWMSCRWSEMVTAKGLTVLVLPLWHLEIFASAVTSAHSCIYFFVRQHHPHLRCYDKCFLVWLDGKCSVQQRLSDLWMCFYVMFSECVTWRLIQIWFFFLTL